MQQALNLQRRFLQFVRWIGNKDSVVLTWGDSDIRVLIDNCRYLNGINKISFLHKYANLQSYFQQIMKTPSSKQVGLVAAAEMLGISIAKYSQHRALDDSMLEAECFKRIYNKKLFNLMIHDVIIRSTKSLIISHIL